MFLRSDSLMDFVFFLQEQKVESLDDWTIGARPVVDGPGIMNRVEHVSLEVGPPRIDGIIALCV